jgi:hypothetical protein
MTAGWPGDRGGAGTPHDAPVALWGAREAGLLMEASLVAECHEFHSDDAERGPSRAKPVITLLFRRHGKLV